MDTKRPLIFISNDDGFDSPGIEYLTNCVSDFADVIVVAPASAQSGKSSSITVEEPLRLTAVDTSNPGLLRYKVNGTPVDCVKLGLHAATPDRRPDLVIAGINHGSNSGNSVIYSGTMGIVMEACMIGIPAIGFSLLHHSWSADFSQCGPIVKEIVGNVLANGLPDSVCLNVNIPARCTPKGIKVVEASCGHWTEEYARYTDPHGGTFYWLTGKFIDDEPDNPNTDNYWLDRQYATIVPVCPDQTANTAIEPLRSQFGL